MRVLVPALVLVWMQIIASVPLKPRELGWYPGDAGMRLQNAITFPFRVGIVVNNVDETSPFEEKGKRPDRNGAALVALVSALVPFLVSFLAVGPWRRPPWVLVAEALRNNGP